MKLESNFCRTFSAVLILFGLSVFAWADCDSANANEYQYECNDISDYDDSHPSASSIVSGEDILDQEIPNSGIILSDPKGKHLGVIGFGGNITGNDNNVKKQVVEFNNLNVTNILDQSDGLKLRFGGYGTYVFGDVVTAAASVIQTMPGNVITDSPTWEGGYINNGIKGKGIFNSSKAEIKLPKGVTKDDIVFARLYWMGHLYPYGKMGSAGEKISATQIEIPDIKGYHDVKLQIEDSKVYDIKRENCQGHFAFVARRFNNSTIGGPRYNMNYTCSADITQLVKENFEDYEDEIEIAVGNINASWKNPHYNYGAAGGNMVWSRAMATVNNNPLYAWVTSNTTYRLPFGGWYVVLVYDKTLKSQAELKGDDFPDKDIEGNKIPDSVKFAKARDADIDGDVKAYIDSHFKAKNVTIYDGYLALEPPVPSDFNFQKTKEECAIGVDFPIKGFFTPKSGKVQGKLIFGGFGANRGKYTDGKLEGIFVSKTWNDIDSKKLPKNNFHPQAFFNGSKTWLELDDEGAYNLQGETGYHQALDMDEFDISDRLGNSQSELALRLRLLPQDNWITNRVFVPFIGVSIDLYVPDLCYEQKMYDTQGWLGFYNSDGSKKDNPDTNIEEVHVVTGENLYYRTEFRNQKGEDNAGEVASGVWVKLNTGRSNTYTPNSSGIDNIPSNKGINGIDDANFVYLEDNVAGAYSTQALRAAGGGGDIDSVTYKDRQLNSLINKELKLYIGEGAGKTDSGEPTGGNLAVGESVYAEFNASIGRTFSYTPIRYTVGYAMNLGDGPTIQGPTKVMDRCETPEQEVKISLLNGLKVVNQNFKDYCDGKYVGNFDSADFKCNSATDVNKTKSQDDRLYTQIAELPFDVNMIFKPDINEVFGGDCQEKVDKKCVDFGKTICQNYAGIFKLNKEGKCVPIYGYELLPDKTWGIKYKKGELDGSLQKFILPGNLYMSAIRAGSGCKYIDNRSKLPFLVDGERYMTDYPTEFAKYQNDEKKLVKPISKVSFEDAFSGVTFMFSYYPRGLNSPDTNTTLFVGDWNSTVAYNYDRTTDTWTEVDAENTEEYYIWLQTQMLYEKYIPGYRMSSSLSEDRKRELVSNWFKDSNNAEKIKEFDDDLEDIKIEISTARTFFGAEMSPDGSFHVCDSDSFVVRPSHFKVDMNAATKYAKLIDPTASGDITEGNITHHKKEYRVGGDYTENTDILGHMFYAESIKQNPVPNYNHIIGGDLGSYRFKIRNSYNLNSASITDALVDPATAWRETKTYLKPFISDKCYEGLTNHGFFIEKDPKNRATNPTLKRTEDTDCTNNDTEYIGFAFENGEYKLADTVDKERNSTKRAEMGRILVDKNCKVDGHIFAEYYTKIWDKDVITLYADFGVKDIEINDGYAQIERFSNNELVAQGLLEPKDKKSVPASLYTSRLCKDKDCTEIFGSIFSYHNVGDVLVSVYDNSWTDAYGDQTFDERVGPDGNYWGTTCIINSTSNIPDEFGKVGCDIGMKDNQELVLRYKPDRIDLAVEGLGMSSSRDKSNNPADNFVYYNSPDIAPTNNTINGYANKSMINQFAELGTIIFNGEAFLSDKLYKNTVATLYDGKIIEGSFNDETYEVARCGFASDMNVTINFGFDCNTNADSRCATDIAAGDIQKTNADILYAPFVDLPNVTYTIPTGTAFLSNNQCSNNNGVSDSRCFTYNRKQFNAAGRLEEAERTDANFGFPLPINLAINYYTGVNRDQGFINGLNQANNIYDPKNPFFVLLARAFDQGVTRNSRVFINFDRMQKSPQYPLYILADDFAITALANNGQIEPAKFNNASVLVNKNGDPLISDAGENEFTDKPYENDDDRYESFDVGDMKHNRINFQQHIATKKALEGLNSQEYLNRVNAVPSILFAYGKANEVNDGLEINAGGVSATYVVNVINSPSNVNILDAVFCGRNNNSCIVFPTAIVDGEDLSPTTNIFSGLVAAPRSNGFITNITTPLLGMGTTPTIRDWVRNYISTSNRLEVERNNPNLQQGQENIFLTASNLNGTNGPVRVEVLTWPWLIYTPFTSEVTIDTIPTNNMGTPIQYFNYFTFAYINNRGQWGGEGQVKGDNVEEGDIGSFITGKDFDDIAAGENADVQSPTIRNDRIDW